MTCTNFGFSGIVLETQDLDLEGNGALLSAIRDT